MKTSEGYPISTFKGNCKLTDEVLIPKFVSSPSIKWSINSSGYSCITEKGGLSLILFWVSNAAMSKTVSALLLLDFTDGFTDGAKFWYVLPLLKLECFCGNSCS